MCGLLQSYLLQRREWVHLQRVDGVLCHPRPYAHEGTKVHDWGIHHTLHREFLDTIR